MNQYFPELHARYGGNVKLKLDLSNYATKAYLKIATGSDTFMLTSKTDLTSVKTKVNNLDVDKYHVCSCNVTKTFQR